MAIAEKVSETACGLGVTTGRASMLVYYYFKLQVMIFVVFPNKPDEYRYWPVEKYCILQPFSPCLISICSSL